MIVTLQQIKEKVQEQLKVLESLIEKSIKNNNYYLVKNFFSNYKLLTCLDRTILEGNHDIWLAQFAPLMKEELLKGNLCTFAAIYKRIYYIYNLFDPISWKYKMENESVIDKKEDYELKIIEPFPEKLFKEIDKFAEINSEMDPGFYEIRRHQNNYNNLTLSVSLNLILDGMIDKIDQLYFFYFNNLFSRFNSQDENLCKLGTFLIKENSQDSKSKTLEIFNYLKETNYFEYFLSTFLEEQQRHHLAYTSFIKKEFDNLKEQNEIKRKTIEELRRIKEANENWIDPHTEAFKNCPDKDCYPN